MKIEGLPLIKVLHVPLQWVAAHTKIWLWGGEKNSALIDILFKNGNIMKTQDSS